MSFWTDAQGRQWKVPSAVGRLRTGKCPGHRALRDFVLERDAFTCRICGRKGPSHQDFKSGDLLLVADHIVSRRNGGSHHPDNLQTLCDPCNCAKAGSVDVGRPLKVKRLGIGLHRRMEAA
jgi:5-methylcytosine-specific restriction endonuclease McrA